MYIFYFIYRVLINCMVLSFLYRYEILFYVLFCICLDLYLKYKNIEKNYIVRCSIKPRKLYKKCLQCECVKKLDSFQTHKNSHDLYRNYCNSCNVKF